MTIYKVQRSTVPGIGPVAKEISGQRFINFRIGPPGRPRVPVYINGDDEVIVNLSRIVGNPDEVRFNWPDSQGLNHTVTARQLQKRGFKKLQFNPENGDILFRIISEGGEISVGRWPDEESAITGSGGESLRGYLSKERG